MMRIEWGSAAARQAGRVCPTGARRNGLLPRASSRKRHTFRKTFIGGTISAAIDCGGAQSKQSTIELHRWLDGSRASPRSRGVRARCRRSRETRWHSAI
jgi:hypothetical protein